MTNEQIIAGNKLIAEFVGGITSDENTNTVQAYPNVWLPMHGVCNWPTIVSGMAEDLIFHESWDWLMPVVGFIEGLELSKGNNFNVTIGAVGYCKISDCFGNVEFVEDGGFKIECVYRCILKFINWYNENKK